MPAIGGLGDAKKKAAQKQNADQQWKKAQAENAGGHYGNDGYTTNFEGTGGLLDLRSMIMNADPDGVQRVSVQWSNIGLLLDQTAGDLGTHVNNLLQNWTGASADAFRANAEDLNTSITNGAQYAHQTSTAMSDASLALAEAQAKMPSMPSDWARLKRSVGGESDIQFHEDAATHGLSWAVQHDGSNLSAVEQAHQKAVVVMEEVGTKYNAASALLADKPPPYDGGGGVWPAPPSGPTGSPVSQPKGAVPGSPGQGGIPGSGGDATGKVKAIHGGVTPEPPQKLVPVGDPSGVNGGVNSGTPPTTVAPPGSTLDGSQGGPTTGSGTGAVGNGTVGVGGMGGLGAGKGTGTGIGGGGYGSVGGVGRSGGFGAAGGGGGGRLGGGARLGAGVEGDGGIGSGAGLAGDDAGMESVGALGGNDGALRGESGVAAGEGGSGSGMGMGGMGGAGRGGNNKKKRKGRAAYLLEDDETWAQGAAPNPPVIG
jgi:uncharacterized protein YukE